MVIAGSHGSGLAQMLSVDQERQSQLDRSQARSGVSSNGNSSESNGSSVGNVAQDNGAKSKKGNGVSLFGSYKAPIKQQ